MSERDKCERGSDATSNKCEKVPEKKDKTNKVFLLASFHLYFVTFRQRNCRGGAGQDGLYRGRSGGMFKRGAR